MGGRGRQISEFKASLVYRVSSRTARTTQRNPVSKNKKQNQRKKKRKKRRKKKKKREREQASKQAGWWWCRPLIPALGRQRQADF